MNSFLDITKNAVDIFIKTVAIVDDEAQFSSESNNGNSIDVKQVNEIFAKRGKVCGIYKVTEPRDIDILNSVYHNADVTILDWRLNIKGDGDKVNDEQDVEIQDPRGFYTLKFLKEIAVIPSHELKLIIIYTGESDLSGIIDTVRTELTKSGLPIMPVDDYSIQVNNLRISVIGKSSLKGRKLRKEIEDRIFSLEELPDAVVREFSILTSGLLSSIILKALGAVRNNALTLLSAFNPTLDSAFLAHRALLPHPNDSEEQILDLIGSEIKSIIKGFEPDHYISKEIIKLYLESSIEDIEHPFDFPDSEKFESVEIPKTLSRDQINKLTEVGIERVFLRRDTPSFETNMFQKNCHIGLTSLFSKNNEYAKESNRRYALLTTIKSNYNTLHEPVLTQGTIVREDTGLENYWVCIQPKCDSVRIEKNRDFLFAPLKKVEQDERFDFILEVPGSFLFLKVQYSMYKAKFFNFKANKNQAVRGVVEADKVVFGGNTRMRWLAELKSDFAQSIANNYSSYLSRVGMDHSEWLRRGAS